LEEKELKKKDYDVTLLYSIKSIQFKSKEKALAEHSPANPIEKLSS
jgi:hypothetical protein